MELRGNIHHWEPSNHRRRDLLIDISDISVGSPSIHVKGVTLFTRDAIVVRTIVAMENPADKGRPHI